MLTLRLFHQSDPFREIDARLVPEGDLSIGRDPGAAWTIDDRECELSRLHCALRLEQGRLTLRDTSTNGVFLGEENERIAPGTKVTLRDGESFRIGRYLVFVDDAAPDDRPALAESTPFEMPETTAAAAAGPRRHRTPGSVGALLDAFCAGARIDPSTLTGEDPLALARRVGAVYHQTVVGLSALMRERASARSEHEMERTTVGAADNNPFKWAPSQRLAVDLLRPRDEVFLSGPEALAASFADLHSHLQCVEAAASAAFEATLAALAPERIDAALDGQSFVLRNRAGEAWRHYQAVHADFAARSRAAEGGVAGEAFRTAYAQRLRELDHGA